MNKATHHRTDIQVLRAIAVIAVIAYHAGLPVQSGFLGVDVFLVISGYVICATLLREGARTGRISIAKFYVRRVRRLFLPLLAMLVVSMVLFWLFGPFAAHESVAKQALSALGFFANFHYFSMVGGYFDPENSASYFLHTWSLSLEEQFYLVFPIVVSLLLVVTRKATLRARSAVVLATTVILAVASLVFAWWLINSDSDTQPFTQPTASFLDRISLEAQSFAFFSPFTRAWQFLVGAVCAVGATRVGQLKNRRVRVALVLVLLALLVMLLVAGGSASTSFFSPNRVGVTIATGLLIYVGFGGLHQLAAIGDRSYSLYLWHFPLLTFASVMFDSSIPSRVAAMIAAVVCAELSYRLIETRSLAIDVDHFFKRARIALVAAVLLFTAVLGAGYTGAAQQIAENVLQREQIAVPVATWTVPNDRCAKNGDGFTYTCSNGEASDSQLILIGDSHALHLALGFGAVADELEMSWSADTAEYCTFARFAADRQFDFCEAWVETTMQRALTLQPELVVLFQCYRVNAGCPQPQMTTGEREKYVAGVAKVIAQLNRAGIAVLQVLDTPAVSPEQASPSLLLNNPRVPIQRGATANNVAIAKGLGVVAAASGGLYTLGKITGGLCTADSCRYLNNSNQPLWFDTDHLSRFGVADRIGALRSVIQVALAQTVSP